MESISNYIVFLYLLLKLNSSTPHDSKFNQLKEIILIKRLPPYNVSPFWILHLNYLYICKNLLDALPHHNHNKKKDRTKSCAVFIWQHLMQIPHTQWHNKCFCFFCFIFTFHISCAHKILTTWTCKILNSAHTALSRAT